MTLIETVDGPIPHVFHNERDGRDFRLHLVTLGDLIQIIRLHISWKYGIGPMDASQHQGYVEG
ncbi:MAG: hypothetical protein ACLFUL_09405 [Desulfobacteraceae bacterium]